MAGFLSSTAVYHFQAVGGSLHTRNPFIPLDLIASTDLLSDVVRLDDSHKKRDLSCYGREGAICSTCGMKCDVLITGKTVLSDGGKQSLLVSHVTYLYFSMTASFKDGTQNYCSETEHLLHLIFLQNVLNLIVCDIG